MSDAFASSTEAVLAISGLTIDLPPGADRPHAVRDVCVSVVAGETVCLIGESGSGKSVIAQAIMGLLPSALRPSQGRITLLGEDILQAPAARTRRLRGRTMSMVFQEPMTALNPVMTCGAQVDEVLAQHSQLPARARRERILDIFEHVRLPDPPRIYDAYPHQLSGGQRQRIVIALALILGPALLICDEPTTALDVTTQAEILSLIRELQRESGTAVLFITHDFGVVAEIADSVLVLRLGEMIEHGDKASVLRHPRNDYTRLLIDSVPPLTPADRPAVQAQAPLLRAISLGKTYTSGSWPWRRRSVAAAADVSLSVHPGETVGIVGESGSGKSTVARCIARLIDPTSGDVFVEGHSVARARGRALSPLRRRVQIVFQDPYRSLDPRRTVGQSIVEGPLNFGVPAAQAWRRARDLMQLVRLRPEALVRYPNEFSGGQRQRICIARALACEPKLLIADEAVSALDVSVQSQILKLFDEIQHRLGIGMLFITHDLRVAAQICDRIIVMRQGRIVEEGPTKEIFISPRQSYTQALIQAAPGRDFVFDVR